MRRALPTACALALACSSPQQMPQPDGGTAPNARFDVSAWKGLVEDDTISFLIELGKAHQGESADLDGDGVTDLLVFHTPDRATHWIWQPGPFPAFEVVRAADGTESRTLWYDNYAFPSEVDFFTNDGGTALFQLDDNNDNHFDRRYARSPNRTDSGYVWVLESTDGGPNGVFAETARWTTEAWSDQSGTGGDKCNGTANMPNIVGLWSSNTPGITLLSDGATGCSLMEKSRLGKALDCARKKLDCLDRVNPTMRNRFGSRLVTDEWHIGCSNPCPGRDATSSARSGDVPAQTNFAKTTLMNATDDELCGLVIHEGLHIGESPYEPETHDKQASDQIYSCGRYCGGCNRRGPNSGGGHTANQDCATCAGEGAGSASKRRACGYKKDREPVGTGYSVCTGGLGTLMTPCPDWHAPLERDCNGKALYSPDLAAGCCNMCPTNAPTNSKVCGAPPFPYDSCSSKPPECP